MDYNVVGWFEIYVNEIPPAKIFYEALFNVQLDQLSMDRELEMWLFPMREGSGAPGAIVKMDGVPGGGNSTVVYFSCQDCETQQKMAPEYGGQIMRPKFSIGEHGFISLVSDPSGNIIGLHSIV